MSIISAGFNRQRRREITQAAFNPGIPLDQAFRLTIQAEIESLKGEIRHQYEIQA